MEAGNGLTSSGVTRSYTEVVRLACRLFASSRLYRPHCLVGTYVVQSSHGGDDGITPKDIACRSQDVVRPRLYIS